MRLFTLYMYFSGYWLTGIAHEILSGEDEEAITLDASSSAITCQVRVICCDNAVEKVDFKRWKLWSNCQ